MRAPRASGGSRPSRTSAHPRVPSRSMTIVVGQRLGDAADHQRGGKGPGLRRGVGRRRRRGRPPPRRSRGARHPRRSRPARGSPQGTNRCLGEEPRLAARAGSLPPRDHEHDHDRIGAREMLRPAGWQSRLKPACAACVRRSALGAEAVAPVPVEERFRHGQKAELAPPGREPRHGDGAQIRHAEGRIVPEEVGSLAAGRAWRGRGDRRACRGRPARRVASSTRQVARGGSRRVPGSPRLQDRDVAREEDRARRRGSSACRVERRGIAFGAMAQERVLG